MSLVMCVTGGDAELAEGVAVVLAARWVLPCLFSWIHAVRRYLLQMGMLILLTGGLMADCSAQGAESR